MRNVAFDFETMGVNVNDCAVIDCSFMVFTTDKMLSTSPYGLHSIDEVFKVKFDVKHQVDNYQYVVYSDTIKWWLEQGDAARKFIKPLPTDLPLDAAMSQIIAYLKKQGKIDYWWCRGNSFDPPILWRLMEATGKSNEIKSLLPHYKLRDTRTYIDAKLDFPKENGFVPINEQKWKSAFVKHDSKWDVLADVLRVQAIVRAEKDLPAVTE